MENGQGPAPGSPEKQPGSPSPPSIPETGQSATKGEAGTPTSASLPAGSKEEEEKAKRLLYCALCKVAVNSLSQLEAHNKGMDSPAPTPGPLSAAYILTRLALDTPVPSKIYQPPSLPSHLHHALVLYFLSPPPHLTSFTCDSPLAHPLLASHTVLGMYLRPRSPRELFLRSLLSALCGFQVLSTRQFWRPEVGWAPSKLTLDWGPPLLGNQRPLPRTEPSTVRSAMSRSTRRSN